MESKFSCSLFSPSMNNFASGVSSNFQWSYGQSLTAMGCTGKIAFITHGWNGRPDTWMVSLAQKLVQYRGGCIILMDWTKYSNNIYYPSVFANDYKKISNAVSRRFFALQAEGILPENIFLYGHSMGARIFIDAAITFGPGKIGEIDGEFWLSNSEWTFWKLLSPQKHVTALDHSLVLLTKLSIQSKPPKMFNASTHQQSQELQQETVTKIGWWVRKQ